MSLCSFQKSGWDLVGFGGGGGRQREQKSGSAGVGSVDPNGSAVIFDDLLTQCQPDTGTAVLVAAVQALKDDEHLVGEVDADADAVVGDAEQPSGLVAVSARAALDDDPRGDSLLAEFHRVTDEVLPQHREQGRVAVDDGQWLV